MFTQKKFKDYLAFSGLDAKPYQVEGVGWMLERERIPWQNVRGGIVADEMGLGKTIMMIGTIMANIKQRTLVVMPLALLQQWKEQIEKTTELNPVIYHGSEKSKTTMDILKEAPIVLTTYGEIQISKNEHCPREPSLVHSIEWGRIVFDEAHHMRNMKTNKFKGCHLLKTDTRWMLTGTPIQNRITDFFALCHVLGFEDTFYSKERESIVKNSMMRRTKETVGIKMSKLHTKTITIPWSSAPERNLAEDIHSSISGLIRGNSIGFAHGVSCEVEDPRGIKMIMMLRARQMCILPKMLEKKFNRYCDDGFIADDKNAREGVEKSSKMDVVCDTLIKRKGNGNRKLVFCHFHMEMDEIKKRCEVSGMSVKMIDGRMKQKDKLLSMTAPWPEVLVLQINTCSEGLNLQEFNEIYFVSPHWNPAVEDQAVARCHRIGQKKDVHVFRFNMESIDENDISQDSYCKSVQENKRKIYTN